MKFTLGAHDLTLSTEEPRMECKAQKLFPHPDYNNTFHDIMLVKIRCTVKNILFLIFSFSEAWRPPSVNMTSRRPKE